jgi:hypothetical protein
MFPSPLSGDGLQQRFAAIQERCEELEEYIRTQDANVHRVLEVGTRHGPYGVEPWMGLLTAGVGNEVGEEVGGGGGSCGGVVAELWRSCGGWGGQSWGGLDGRPTGYNRRYLSATIHASALFIC